MKDLAPMIETAIYDTKPYDTEYLARAAIPERITLRFHDFRLTVETASVAKGAQAVCIFVNDQADRTCLEVLASIGVRLIALRCAGHNNVDLTAARELGLAVVRYPLIAPAAHAGHAPSTKRTDVCTNKAWRIHRQHQSRQADRHHRADRGIEIGPHWRSGVGCL